MRTTCHISDKGGKQWEGVAIINMRINCITLVLEFITAKAFACIATIISNPHKYSKRKSEIMID